MQRSLFFPIVLCSLTTPLLSAEEVVVKLSPPKISSETISQKIVCTRPMREGRFNISTEIYKGAHGRKTIVNCYGHGGSGWTTLFGSVSRAIELFEKKKMSKKVPIRVVGAGCMGLTAAIELSRRGYHVSGITTKCLYDLASWRAAGYFALVSVATSQEEQANLNAIGMNTFLAYQQIEKGEHPYISSEAVRYMPVYCSSSTEAGVEELEEKGLIPPKELVTLDFGNGQLHRNYIKYMTYFMNTTVLMRQLWAEVEKRAIPVDLREIHSFGDLKEEIVFNCTGLGAGELCKDKALIPVRGHFITLKSASGTGHMDYMIYTKVDQGGKDEYIYMFPKNISVTPDKLYGLPCRGVLGGTFIQNVEKMSHDEQQKLDALEFKRMLDRLSLFFHGRPFVE